MRVRSYCEGYENCCVCTDCDERRHFEEHEYEMYLAEVYKQHKADTQPMPEISLDEQPF